MITTKFMKLNFSELCSKREIIKPLEIQLNEEVICFDLEKIKVIEPLRFKGIFKAYNDVIEIIGNITGVIELMCSRCLKSFSYNINLDINEEFTNNKNKEEESIILVEGDVIDMAEMIVNNVISTLPIKKLCNEDCKGLCHECGVDLNIHSCTCNTQDVDIRMAKLMDLFK